MSLQGREAGAEGEPHAAYILDTNQGLKYLRDLWCTIPVTLHSSDVTKYTLSSRNHLNIKHKSYIALKLEIFSLQRLIVIWLVTMHKAGVEQGASFASLKAKIAHMQRGQSRHLWKTSKILIYRNGISPKWSYLWGNTKISFILSFFQVHQFIYCYFKM